MKKLIRWIVCAALTGAACALYLKRMASWSPYSAELYTQFMVPTAIAIMSAYYFLIHSEVGGEDWLSPKTPPIVLLCALGVAVLALLLRRGGWESFTAGGVILLIFGLPFWVWLTSPKMPNLWGQLTMIPTDLPPPESLYHDSLKPGSAGPKRLKIAPPSAPTLVETGSFKVDRPAALGKLSRFQLADPYAFLIPWIRCASASKAKTIRLDKVRDGLRMSFDGAPLTPEELTDPYACLFGSGEDEERGRHLAYGLLSALRLGPRGITLRSGFGDKRACLRIGGRSEKPLPEAALAGGSEEELKARTVIHVLCGTLRSLFARDAFLERARESFGLYDADFRIQGRPVRVFPAAEEGFPLGVSPNPLRISGLLFNAPAAASSRQRLYKQGAFVCELKNAIGFGMDALLSCDELRLNLSQSGAVRDEVLEAVLEAARKAARLHKKDAKAERSLLPPLPGEACGLAWEARRLLSSAV